MGYVLRMHDDTAIWAPYPAAGDESYKIRPLRPKDMDHFRKMATKLKWERNQRVEDLDREKYNALLADHIIEDWTGVFADEAHQQPVPCTLDAKVMLMANSLDRANWLVDTASAFANDDEARKEAASQSFRAVDAVPAGPSRV